MFTKARIIKRHRIVSLALFLATLMGSTQAQVSNLNVNYEVQVDALYFDNDWDPFASVTNSVLIDVYENGWTGEHCLSYSTEGITTLNNVDYSLHVGLNRPYYQYLAFDLRGWGQIFGSACAVDPGDLNEMYQLSDDDGLQNVDYVHEAGKSGEWSIDWSNQVNNWIFNDNTFDMKIRTTWRYSDGDAFSNPLEFGPIAANNSLKVHQNANRDTPANATTPHVGYPNNIGQGSSEVIYSFSLSETSTVTMTTDDPETNYDTYLHLFDANQNVIAVNDDIPGGGTTKSRITETLCAGTYYIVVEGYSSNEGDFTLYLEWLSSESMSISLSSTDASCPAASDGNVSLNVSGGVAPFQYSWQDGSTSANLNNVPPGAYSVFVTDGCGQTEFADIFVGISDNEAPVALCRNLTYTLEPGESVFFDASQIDDGSYDNCSIQEIAIDIEQVSYDMVGDNFVTLTVYDDSGNQSSCTATVTVIQDMGNPNSVRDLATGIPFSLQPNPTSEVVFVDLDGQNLSMAAQLLIRDLTGRTLWSGPAVEGRIAIDLSTFRPGMYLVEIRDKDLAGIQRLMIQ